MWQWKNYENRPILIRTTVYGPIEYLGFTILATIAVYHAVKTATLCANVFWELFNYLTKRYDFPSWECGGGHDPLGIFLSFYSLPARRKYAMYKRGVGLFATATCLSVCPSVTAGIVSSRAKAGSWNVHLPIAPLLHFLESYDSSKNSQRVTLKESAKWECWGRFLAIFDQYVAISRKRYILDTRLL